MPELGALPNLGFAHLAGVDPLTINNFIVPELHQSGISNSLTSSPRCETVSPSRHVYCGVLRRSCCPWRTLAARKRDLAHRFILRRLAIPDGAVACRHGDSIRS